MHTDFILSDIMYVVRDGFQTVSCLPNSILTIPVVEYMLHSIFLRVTGYQEQKVKCTAWQLATHDYTFRYKFLSPRYNIGDASSLEQKSKVLESLISQTNILGDSSLSHMNEEITAIIDNMKDECCRIMASR